MIFSIKIYLESPQLTSEINKNLFWNGDEVEFRSNQIYVFLDSPWNVIIYLKRIKRFPLKNYFNVHTTAKHQTIFCLLFY